MGDENSANPNTGGIKQYRDSIIRRISDETIKTDKLTNQFPEITEDAKDLESSEFAGQTDDVTVGSDANPQIAHTSDLPHSFSHDIDEQEIRANKGMGKVGKTDDTAKGE